MKHANKTPSTTATTARPMARRARQTRQLRQLAAALAAGSLLTLCPAAGWAQTLPSGLNIVQGQASVSTLGKAMTVNNSPNAVLNWNSFSIGAQNSVRFEQQNAASQVLNRVTGNDPSSILGRLSSNGGVWLLNPNGVLFGAGARVDVASLVTSTLNLNDSDWLAGRHLFTGSNPGGSVLNQGELRSSLGGSVWLLGGTVRNEGLIDAPGGHLVLAAGHSIELLDTGAPRLSVRVTASAGEALNLGTLAAAGGRIDIHAAVVNQQGIVRADTLSSGAQGEILLRASQALNLSADSSTRADGPSGGQITLDSGHGATLVHGEVSALGSEGRGGQITLLGRQVGVMDAAHIDASGAAGGGQVRIGGGQQGLDASLPNAEAVFFGRNASISADATTQGDGGRIILWSDRSTRAFGSLSAQGGRLGGDGGFIETSGGWLDARPLRISTSAPLGKAGQWLLDPYDVYIIDGASGSNFDANFQATGDNAVIDSATLVAALNSGIDVTVSTGAAGNTGTQGGDITLSSAHIVAGGNGSTLGALSLHADRNIWLLSAEISSLDQPLSISMSAARGSAGVGAIDISGSTLDSRGGNISLGGLGLASGSLATAPFAAAVGFGTAGVGVSLSHSTLSAGAGTLLIQGSSAAAVAPLGVKLDNTTVSAAVIDIKGWAAGELGGTGVEVDVSSLQADKRLLLNGTGTAAGVSVWTGSALTVSPALLDSTDVLSITGYSTAAGGVGVKLDGSLDERGLQLSVASAAGLTILGSGLAGDTAVLLSGYNIGLAPVIDARSSSGLVDIRSESNLGNIELARAQLHGSSSGLTIAGAQTDIVSSSVNAAGPVRVFSNITTLDNTSSISSSASGDAVVLAGSAGNMSRFVNQAGSSGLQASQGRWLIYATDPQNDTDFAPGSLAYDFRQYGASYPLAPAVAGVGNGYLFSTAYTATAVGDVVAKPYDGSRDATVANLNFSGLLSGDTVASLSLVGQLQFADKNAGLAKAVGLGGLSATFEDANLKPVYGYLLQSSLIGDINPKQITGVVTGTSKVYDAGTAAAATVSSLSGLVGTELVSALASGNFDNKNVGSGKSLSLGYTLQDGSGGGLASNYAFAPVTTAVTADITAASLAVTGLSASNKVYDANRIASLTGVASFTPLGSDQLTLGGSGLASFADKNVGVGKAVTVTGYTLGGVDAGNYLIAQPTGLTANISQANLAVTGLSAANKTYDATTAAILNGTAGFTALGSDSLTLGGSGLASFVDKNVGVGKAVTVTGYTLGGADAGNYLIAQPTGLTANIAQANLAVTGLSAANKTYDATTAATLSGTAAVAALGADSLTLGGSGLASFADKNVGVGKAVTVTGYTLGGTDAGNYLIAQPTGLTANIAQASLAVTGLSAANKTYDATTAATVSGTAAVAALGLDSLTLGGSGLASFADKNVGVGKAVSATGYTLGGTDAGNYLIAQPTGLTANIAQANLAVTGLSAANKTYDATTAATLSGAAAVAALGADSLTLGGSGLASFADKNVGVGKAVTVTGYTLGGVDAGNYLIAQPTGLTANISQATLAVSGLSAANKTYDATTAATLNGTAGFTALGSDSLTLSGSGLASFADKNVGVGKAITVTGYMLGGTDAGNYLIAQPTGLTANIAQATLAVTGLSAANKTYDATTAATLNGTAGFTALGSDSLTLSGSGLASFVDKNVGVGKAVTVTGYTLGGTDAGNYLIAQPTGLTANIAQANLAVTGLSAANKTYDATTAATLSGTAAVAPLGADSLTLSGSGLASFVDKNVGVGKAVTVTGYTLGGTDAGNYRLLSPFQLAADITPASLQYVADAAAKRAGEALPVFSGSVTGFLGADNLQNSSAGQLVFTTAASPLSPAGSYAVLGGGLVASNYSFSQAPGNATALSVAAVIPEVPLVQSAVAALSAVFLPQIAPVDSAPGGMLNILASTTSTGATATSAAAGLADGVLPASTQPALSSSNPQAIEQAFGQQRLAGMSQEALAQMLNARDNYKKTLFAEAIYKLEQNPSLGELRGCATLSDLAGGNCVITADIKRQLKMLQGDSSGQSQQALAAPIAPPTPVVTALPGQPLAPSVETPAAAATLPPSILPTAPEPIKRRVKTAALPQIERKVAVMIGVNNYADSAIPQLSNAVADSRAVGRLLGESFGYETVLLDNASKVSVVAALNQLALELGPRDSVVIYYAGHGELVPSTGLGYWQLSDSDAKRPETWLSNADIGRMIAQFEASQVALISDSCYSGSLVSEQRIRATPGTVDPQAVLAKKSVVVMSSGGNEPVFDEGRDGHSLFAWNLMNSLKQVPAWQMGGNLFERVRFAVARELPQRPQYGSSSAAGHQLGGDYLFEQRQLEAVN